ncbi:MAG: hypothetical protein WAM00_09440 [Salegentibacter sp.]
MLSKGLRDEENEKMNRLLNEALQMEFVPDLWKNQQREALNRKLQETLNLTLEDIENSDPEELLKKLQDEEFSFANYEQFGDLMMKLLPMEAAENQPKLAKTAVAVYEFAQRESQTFSFSLIQKINEAKAESEDL